MGNEDFIPLITSGKQHAAHLKVQHLHSAEDEDLPSNSHPSLDEDNS